MGRKHKKINEHVVSNRSKRVVVSDETFARILEITDKMSENLGFRVNIVQVMDIMSSDYLKKVN
jgi:hypothetical protein